MEINGQTLGSKQSTETETTDAKLFQAVRRQVPKHIPSDFEEDTEEENLVEDGDGQGGEKPRTS